MRRNALRLRPEGSPLGGLRTTRAGWRREWDSNPRWYRYHAGFQDRCLKPLGHLSKTDSVPSWAGLLGPSLGLTPAAMLACGARLRRSKFVPDEFVEPTVVSLPRRFSRPVP